MKREAMKFWLLNSAMVVLLASPYVSEGIRLTSTLNADRVAHPLERITFTCMTIGTSIQEWYSDAYITGDDDRIQLHEGRRNGTGRAASAMIVSISSDENGSKVIISELYIIVSAQYQMPTVSCGNNGQGMRENIPFTIQAVALNSTLDSSPDGYIAYPHQMVYFTCMTTGSSIQEWYSDSYITGDDDRIQLHEGRRNGTGRAASATIINIYSNELGERVVVSRLSIVVLSPYPVSTVSCGNNGRGMRVNITFNITDPPAPRISSTLRPEGFACPGDRVRIRCVTLDSMSHTWTSENYTGEDIRIRHTSPIGHRRNSLRFPNTSVELVSKSQVNGRQRLASRLTILILKDAIDQIHTVTCSHMTTAETFSFRIAGNCSDSVTTLSQTTTRGTVASNEERRGDNSQSIIGAVIGTAVFLAAAIILGIVLFIRYRKGKGKVNCVEYKGKTEYAQDQIAEKKDGPLDAKVQDKESVSSSKQYVPQAEMPTSLSISAKVSAPVGSTLQGAQPGGVKEEEAKIKEMSTTVKVERQGFEEDNIQQELELSEAKETDEKQLQELEEPSATTMTSQIHTDEMSTSSLTGMSAPVGSMQGDQVKEASINIEDGGQKVAEKQNVELVEARAENDEGDSTDAVMQGKATASPDRHYESMSDSVMSVGREGLTGDV